MITLADFYKSNTPSMSNSKDMDISFTNTEVFPKGGVYIGEFTSATGHQVPALIPLQDANGLCFLETQDNKQVIYSTIQTIALRLAASINPRLCKFTLYDPTGLGANLISLVRLSSEIKGAQVITDPDTLKKSLLEIKKSIPDTIQNVLGYQYLGKTLMDYNSSAEEMAKPYRFIFIVDFPVSLTEEHQNLIEDIVRNGKQAGIFVVLGLDTTFSTDKTYQVCNPKKLLDLMTVVYPSKDRYYIKNIQGAKFYNKFRLTLNSKLPDVDLNDSLVDIINERLKEDSSLKVELSDILTDANFWSRSSSRGIEVPIGKVNARVLQNLSLSVEDGILDSPHHCIIGGATGSGKTVLLHDIICNAAWLYSPKELQFILLDFKEGTEFKIYEDLPHVRVLSTRSDLDFAKSVFDYLDKEIARRGDLFKEKKVANIGRYNEVAETPLPRIILIVDEFQKLLDGNVRSVAYFGTALEDFGRRARSFGINMLLATQSLAGVNFQHALSHFGLRIVMKLNTVRDCTSFLDYNNSVPYTDLTSKGAAVYNARGGLLNGNVVFQAAYIGETKLLNLINRYKEAAVDHYGETPASDRFVYDGARAADINNNKLLEQHQGVNDKECVVFVGEYRTLSSDHVSFRLQKKKSSNIVVVGKDEVAGDSLVKHIVRQFLSQSSSSSSVFVLDNAEYEENPLFELLEDDRVIINDGDEAILSAISDLYADFETRQGVYVDNKSRNLIVLKNLYGIRELKKEKYGNPPEALKKLLTIIAEGPSKGIHILLCCSMYKHFSDMFESSLAQFDTRIELKGGDGYNLFKGCENVDKVDRQYSANILLPKEDEPIRIKLYK